MGTGADGYIESWLAAVAAFNAGDSGPLMELLADDCAMDFADATPIPGGYNLEKTPRYFI